MAREQPSRLRRAGKRPTGRHELTILVRLLVLLSLVFSSGSAWAAEVTPTARVKRSVVVRSEPTTSSSAVGGLAPSDRATLEEERPGWYRITVSDGTMGYVSKAWTVVSGQEPLFAIAAGELRAHVIDVGTGLAVFVEGPGFTLLYDGGSQDDLADGPDNRIVAYIHAVRPDVTTIDHLVLSHPHKDHLELLPDVFAEFSIRNVWDSGAINRTVGYCRFLKAVQAEPGVLYHDAIATGGIHEVSFTNGGCRGDIAIPQASMMTDAPVPLGPGSTMTILWRDASHHADPNENTVVVRLDTGGRRLLLAGDAEAGGRQPPATSPSANSIEAGLLACCPASLRADALVVGHHGSLTSSRRAFLDAVGARLFVVSSGPHPYSGVVLPDAAVIAELTGRGRVFRTDVDDDACGLEQRKVGPDADESPGGCSSVLVNLSQTGVVADYSPARD
jgi:competence protein ComEC